MKIKKREKKERKIKKKENVRSIKGKLVIALFCASLILLSVTGIIISSTVSTRFTENEKQILQETVNSISNEAELFFLRYITIAEQMAQDKNLQSFLVNAEIGDKIEEVEGYDIVRQTLIDTQKKEADVMLSAYIAESDPSYYVDDISGVSDASFDLKTRDYYVTMTDDVINVTEPYVDVATGNMVITITAPVKVNNKVVGLTGIDITIEALSKVVGDSKLGNNGYFYLLTNDNVITSHKDEDNILKSINEIEVSDNLLQEIDNSNNEIIKYTYNNEKYMGSSITIGDTGWKVVSAMPEGEFNANKLNLMITIIIIYIITIIILSLLMYIIIGKLTKPIKKITEVTNKLALGELDVDINIKSNDEIGELAKSIDSLTKRLKSYIIYINESVMVLDEFAMGNLVMDLENDYKGEFAKLKGALEKVSSTLKDIIGRIKDSSDSININAEQVSSGSQALAQGTTEQASSIEELSAEINEIYSTIVANAENAENAGKKALESANEVDKGNAQMKEMLDAIDEISMSSSEIGKIIKVIDDIAFQTNILALNAAVEAARAGSAGKGFAVVADEVRNLAGKSAEAAKQTTSLIENSITAINKGTSLADEAGKSLSGIVSKTKETNDLITEIVNASAQQTVSVNQIRDGIEQISSVVQENAATAEASAANSEELSGQVQILKELIDNFNVEEEESESFS
ncbi:methyl-accepting chemotaxis protein [Sedimentibacter sp. MB31-C6]|uniref:methyl-accepting chemotaxis protein n=1 Tax=Sedimentibacter sp. MB31-C6 TaxID=3109366 RepID=UPI002DDD8FA4|nr:methyl-accepting chemotaxis protein [Sedimentibacter sp. MB36-C1]WSI04407.1 methyl-accepting chemotaxis protein [Sedimentibacter sp. MB36-C1]